MTRSKIKIGVARKDYIIERYPAHIVKIARKMQFEIWNVVDHSLLTSGTLAEIRTWAAERGYILTWTNRLGKEIFANN